jgi:hypothetical protein
MHLKMSAKISVAVVLTTIATAIVVTRFLPGPSLEQFAKGAMRDLVEGRADALYSKFSESEIQELGVDEYRFRKIVAKIREEVDGKKVGDVKANSGAAGAIIISADIGGGETAVSATPNWGLSMVAFDTGQGFRVGGFESLVTWYYNRQFPVANEKLRGNPAMAVSVLKGLQRDREFWMSMGVKGLPGLQPGIFRPWAKFAEDKYKLLQYKGVKPEEVGLPDDWRKLNL